MTRLSVVIIGRNEQAHIEKCLQTVLVATDSIPDKEIMYVDSASEDASVEIAAQFPIRILQLKPDWHLTPSAGRYIGFHHTTGEYVLFVDGDTLMFKRWVACAAKFMDQHPDVGAVAGVVHEADESRTSKRGKSLKNLFRQDYGATFESAQTLGGIALYRRAAMEEAGTFNPYLPTDEEWDVAMRIRRAGYRVGRLSATMCLTFAPPRQSIREIIRCRHARYYDYGTTMKNSWNNGYFWQYSMEQIWFFYTYLGAVGVVVMGLLVALWKSWLWQFAVIVGATVLFLVFKKTTQGACISFLKRSMIAYRTMRSLLLSRGRQGDPYPTDAIIIK